MSGDLTEYSLLPIFLVSTSVILAASEVGRRLGVRAAGRGGDNITTLEGAILGLLALMISFTFAMALSRFEARRDALLNEANAIGTTALRSRPAGTTRRRSRQALAGIRSASARHDRATPLPSRIECRNFPLERSP